MKAEVWSFSSGKKEGEVDLAPRIFQAKINKTLIHQGIVGQLANRRQGTSSSKTRSEVHGTTKKPWAQKKTGRARAGSNKSPLWRGGGITFGPHPRSYRTEVPKKMRQRALFSVLSLLAGENKIFILKDIALDAYSTSTFLKSIKPLVSLDSRANNFRCIMVVTNKGSERDCYDYVRRSAANLPWIKLVHVGSLELKDMYYAGQLIFTKQAYDDFVASYKEKSKADHSEKKTDGAGESAGRPEKKEVGSPVAS